MKILVVDDDRAIGLALQMAVEDLGHECVVAEDGTTAWDLVRRHAPDTIISDWRMPGLEGPELCRRIRAEASLPYVYFILLTVLSDSRSVLEGMQAGADDFLTKPFTVDALHARLIAAERVTRLHHSLAEREAGYLRLADERQQLLEQLARERSQLETVIQQLPAGVLIVAAPSGAVLMANHHVERIWRQTMTASTVFAHERKGFHPDGRPYQPAEWPLARAILAGEVVSGEEIDVIRGDGSHGTFRHSAAPIRDGDKVVAAVAVMDDITEERRRQRDAAQDAKLRALGQLASGVAHDLNQSLALVTGYAEIVRTALEDPASLSRDEIGEMLRIITQAAYDGGETVKRLLTFGRGPADGTREVVDLGTLLDDVAKLTAPRWRDTAQAEDRPIVMRVQVDPGAVVTGRQADLREALTSLVFNAVDALPTGGAIGLRARTLDDRVVIEVADSGVGMPLDVQDRIFEPFFTTKGEHGTGLGLAMVFGIVERHDGKISVDSAPGQGTTVRIELPAVSPESARGMLPVTGVSGSLRILVVDDYASIRLMLSRILAEQGHQVVHVGSGEEALERIVAEQFDLLLSDIGLGEGMNGWRLATEVRRRWPEIKVVLGTGWAASIDQEAARALGISAVISKPYRSADLAKMLASL